MAQTTKKEKNVKKDEKKLSKAELLRRKENRSAWIKTICAVLVIALVIGGFVFNDYAVENGTYKRAKTAAVCEDEKVTGTMMSYFFFNEYTTFVNQYSSYLSYFGLSTSTSLKLQVQDEDTGATWYDYFLNLTKNDVSFALSMVNKAQAAGMTLDSDDIAEIDKLVADIESYAKSNNQKADEYVASLYGTGVKVSDLRACVELTTLAEKYYNAQQDLLNYTDAEIDAYYTENANTYKTAAYRMVKLEYGDEKDIATASEANKLAQELAACTDNLTFDSKLSEFYTALKNTDDTAKYTEAEVNTLVGNTYVIGAGYVEDSEISKWAFAADTTVGSTKIINEEGSYTVLMLNTVAARDESLTVNARHILLEKKTDESDEDYKARAEALLKTWQDGEATEDSFAALVADNSIDIGSAKNGGLYENIIKGKMTTEFDAWIYDSARKAGDCAVVKTADYGYHIIYFVGNGDATWKQTVRADMESKAGDDLIEAVEEEFPVTFYDKKISSLVA